MDNGSTPQTAKKKIREWKNTKARQRRDSIPSASGYSSKDGISKLAKVKAPAKYGQSSVEFGNGYSATFIHEPPGYGTGGILKTVIKNQGQLLHTSKERWGSSGMATAEHQTKAQAFKAAKREAELYAKIEPKKKKRNSAPF